jgi:Aminopeptidase N
MRIKSYDITLDFDFNGLTYQGLETVSVETEDDLVLDAQGLEILEVEASGKPIPFGVEKDKVRIRTGKFSGEVKLKFSGKVKDSLVGIYKAPYDGKYVITTQFEATHARKFIPCVDHPAYKATFKLRVIVNDWLKVISNMPLEDVRKEGDKVVHVFKDTPPMSTYLLYLGIGEFEEMRNPGVPEIIVATVPGKLAKASLPASMARDFIRSYEEYFGIKYQLPKVHLIAIPEFAYGAMENWGAITFRETALLADDRSGFSQIRRAAEVIAHELAHQWFGNLVTMKWWNDLWLNESFATFMSYKILDKLYPDWYMWGEFLRDETAGALLKDSIPTTHPIETEVKSPEEVEQMFDDISYGKGASILRMIEGFVGEEEFRRGISSYLNKFKFGNAEGRDLWESLERESGKPVSRIMPEWILRPGYPMVSVEYDGGKLVLTQSRFGLLSDGQEVYPIPLTMEVNGKIIRDVMDTRRKEFEVGALNTLNVNLRKGGFYRVLYRDLEPVFRSNLTPEEQWGLLNDYFAFLLAGKVTFEEYSKVLRHFMTSDHHLPVTELADQLSLLYAVNSGKYGNLALQFHREQVRRWENRSDMVGKRTFSILATNLARMDLNYSKTLGAKFQEYENLDGDLKAPVAVAYSVFEGPKAVDVMLEKYRTSKFDEDRLKILQALLSSRYPHTVVNVLSMVFTGEMKRQDIARSLEYTTFYPDVRDAVWEWLKIHFERVSGMYSGTGIFGRALSDVIPLLGLGRETEVEEFFRKNPLKENERGVRQGLEIMKALSRLK